MKFEQFLDESRYMDKELEKGNASEFMRRYGGNIFPIKGKNNKVVNFVWSIHSMSRFLQRDISEKKVQSLLEKIALHYDDINPGLKFLVYSKSLDQALVISKNNDRINILTVYPVGASTESSDTHKVILESAFDTRLIIE